MRLPLIVPAALTFVLAAQPAPQNLVQRFSVIVHFSSVRCGMGKQLIELPTLRTGLIGSTIRNIEPPLSNGCEAREQLRERKIIWLGVSLKNQLN